MLASDPAICNAAARLTVSVRSKGKGGSRARRKGQGNQTTSLQYPVNRPHLPDYKLHPERTLSSTTRLSHRCLLLAAVITEVN